MESYQNQSGAEQTHQQLYQFGNPVPVTTGAFGTAGGPPVIVGGGGLSGIQQPQLPVDLRPGHHESHDQTSSYTSSTTVSVYNADTGAVHHHKRGVMDKIKDKLSGGPH